MRKVVSKISQGSVVPQIVLGGLTTLCLKNASPKVFLIFLPNVIIIDPYNFELYRFKFDAFFETVYYHPAENLL